MSFSTAVQDVIQRQTKCYEDLANAIWTFAEIEFNEFQSSDVLASYFEHEGYRVKRGIANIPTAFCAEYGSGSPVIAILGEYDALSNLSQESNVVVPAPIVKGGNGHGCGHQLLGVAGVAAVDAIKDQLAAGTLSGTVRYYGCPAEEGGGGKVFMVRAGVFDDVDIAITWHPGSKNGVMSYEFLATTQYIVTFKGRSSHAAASPHLGRSALDAIALVNVGINYLREHMIDDARIHYAYTNTGGKAANVVQAEAQAAYMLRGPNMQAVMDLYTRFEAIIKGASLMTDCTYDITFDGGASDVILNETLELTMQKAFDSLQVPTYTDEEKAFAYAISQTYASTATAEEPIATEVEPYRFKKGNTHGSTDVGDVSWVVPTVQCQTATFAKDTPLHTWQTVAQGQASYAHKAMLFAGEVMALTALQLFGNPALIVQAKEEHAKHLAGKSYASPLSSDLDVTQLLPKEPVRQ